MLKISLHTARTILGNCCKNAMTGNGYIVTAKCLMCICTLVVVRRKLEHNLLLYYNIT